jgi:hypothetical protein
LSCQEVGLIIKEWEGQVFTRKEAVWSTTGSSSDKSRKAGAHACKHSGNVTPWLATLQAL